MKIADLEIGKVYQAWNEARIELRHYRIIGFRKFPNLFRSHTYILTMDIKNGVEREFASAKHLQPLKDKP